MFKCAKCSGSFVYSFSPLSYGKCESCNTIGLCADIPAGHSIQPAKTCGMIQEMFDSRFFETDCGEEYFGNNKPIKITVCPGCKKSLKEIKYIGENNG